VSRSFKKNHYCGITTATSEKDDKRRARRNLRHKIEELDVLSWDNLIIPLLREVSNIWNFSKDGKHFVDVEKYPKSIRK
jgi:hypothetical protein